MQFMILLSPLILIAAAAPVGATVCGAMAIFRIRRSGGRMCGLGLALADALLFPLLLLDGLILIACNSLARVEGPIIRTPGGGTVQAAQYNTWLMMLGLVLCVILDVVIAKWAWRAINRPIGPTAPPGSQASRVTGPPSALGAVLLCLGAFVWLGAWVIILHYHDKPPLRWAGLIGFVTIELAAFFWGIARWQAATGKAATICSALMLLGAAAFFLHFTSRAQPIPERNAQTVAESVTHERVTALRDIRSARPADPQVVRTTAAALLEAIRVNDFEAVKTLAIGSVEGWSEPDPDGTSRPSSHRMGWSVTLLKGAANELRRDVLPRLAGSIDDLVRETIETDSWAAARTAPIHKEQYLLLLFHRTGAGWRFVSADDATGPLAEAMARQIRRITPAQYRPASAPAPRPAARPVVP